jgi:hypothetical protein
MHAIRLAGETTVPKSRCSICLHPERQAIEETLKAGGSVRSTAVRFGLSHAAVHRHVHEGDEKKTRVNAGQIAHIDAEIEKLKRAQNRARKKRDSAGALAIAKELRNWFVLRQKAEIVEIASSSESTDGTEVSLPDATQIAKSVIESQLLDVDIQAWLRSLIERIPSPLAERNERATGKLPDTPV